MMLDNRGVAEHRLLRELGGMTLTEMRSRMSTAEFREHAAYWKRLAAESEVYDG